MATKRELIARWKREPGLTIWNWLYEYSRGTPVDGHQRNSREILAALEGLPYRDEVPNGGDLRGVALEWGVRSIDFHEWDFSYSTMYMNLVDCDLRSAKFDFAIVGSLITGVLDDASFRNAKMRKANIRQSHAHRCCFDNAELNQVGFIGTDLTGSSFKNANATWANFTKTTLFQCDFTNATLDDSVFRNVRIDKTTDLRGASLINLQYLDRRDNQGNLVDAGTDWRLANYDETTKYGEDPSAEDLNIIRGMIALLKRSKEAAAPGLIERLKRVQSTLKKNYRVNWLDEVSSESSMVEQELLLAVWEQAINNL